MSEELQALYESGKPQEVLDQFTRKENTGEWATLPEEEQIACIYYKCRALGWLGRFEEALQTATVACTTYMSTKNQSSLLGLLAAQFFASSRLGISRLEEAQSVLVEGDAILKNLTDNERQTGAIWVAIFEHVKGLGFSVKNEFDRSLEYYHKALKSFEALDNRHGMAVCLVNAGHTYFMKRERETALENLKQSQILYESLGNKRGIGECFHNMGLVYWANGELDTSLEYYQLSLQFAETGVCPLLIYYALTHIGTIYTAKGDPDRALDYFRKSLAVVEPLGLDSAIAYNFVFL
jgi:tetratricopeptide (TPR) repeat protein